MKSAYSELVKKILKAVRNKAQEIPKFRDEGNGAIRILAYPECEAADIWFGGLGDFSERPYDIPDYEATFAITSGGSRVVTGEWDGVKQEVDCYAYSALKIAHCSLAQDLKAGLLSGLHLDKPYITEDNGYGPHYGALCVEVKEAGSQFCGIYVCVSGADSKDDLKCAFEAVEVIKKFFADEPRKYELKTPERPGFLD